MSDPVCVVGAGGAGLAAARALQRRAIPYKVFETRDVVGGMWAQGPDTAAYDSLTSNTSRWRTHFDGHRMRPRSRPFIHHTEFARYLQGFARTHNLAVETNAKVERAEPDGNGGWRVTVDGREPRRFRAVVGAVGFLNTPRPAHWPGTFDGPRVHSARYRSPDPFRGKDVVIAGLGTSAGEIAGELVEHARSVTVAGSTGLHMVTNSLFVPWLSMDLLDVKHAARLYPFWMRRWMVRQLMTLVAGPPGAHGLPKPDHRVLERPPLGSDTFVKGLKRGRFDIRPRITRLDGDTIHFADGSSRHADALIEATGYDPSFEWLPGDLMAGASEHHMPLYRGVLHAQARNLYFVAMAAGPGAILPVADAQARWVAAHIDGQIRIDDLARRYRAEGRKLKRQFGRPHPIWRDRWAYVIELDREVRARASPARAWSPRRRRRGPSSPS